MKSSQCLVRSSQCIVTNSKLTVYSEQLTVYSEQLTVYSGIKATGPNFTILGKEKLARTCAACNKLGLTDVLQCQVH